MKRWASLGVTLVLAGLPVFGQACIMRPITEADARDRADLIVVAEFVEAKAQVDHGWMRNQDFVVRIKHVIRGEAAVDELLTLSLTNMRARANKDGSIDCFELKGSGAEEEYVAGQNHLWMISTSEDGEGVLWSGPVN